MKYRVERSIVTGGGWVVLSPQGALVAVRDSWREAWSHALDIASFNAEVREHMRTIIMGYSG